MSTVFDGAPVTEIDGRRSDGSRESCFGSWRAFIEHQRDLVGDGKRVHLDGDHWNRTVEEADHIQEPARDVLCDDDRTMFVLRIATPLDVPVLDCSNNGALVSAAKLDLDFVPAILFGVLKKEIEATSMRLPSFLVLQHDIAKSE